MKIHYRILFLTALLGSVGFTGITQWHLETGARQESSIQSTALSNNKSGAWIDQETKLLKAQADNLNPKVLRLSLLAYSKAKKEGLTTKPVLTVIDYSKPSNQKRLWVFDLSKGKELFNTWVSHGKNSGGLNATSFSNRAGSLKSSLGVFVTGRTYIGGKGYALKLKGLESGYNSNALERSIVMHGAWYVNPDIIKSNGQSGRSWGCPAVSTQLAKPIINTIKDNSLVFAYYPDQNWLNHSRFLT